MARPWPPDDGLPRTQHLRIFPDATRNAVMLTDEPADAAGLAVFRHEERGLLPGNGITRWLVVREADGPAIGACLGR